MNKEIEAKFLHVDFNDIRHRLTGLGAVLEQPMRLMRRALIDTPEMIAGGRDAFIRIRDEGNRVTVTFKEFKANTLDGAEEREIVVSNFDDALEIFAEAGLKYRSFQESKRETWRLGETEIVLDEWPWLDTYIEVEAPTEDLVKGVSKKLGFTWDQAIFGSVDRAYKEQYPGMEGRGAIDLPEVRFGDPLPDIFKSSINKSVQ